MSSSVSSESQGLDLEDSEKHSLGLGSFDRIMFSYKLYKTQLRSTLKNYKFIIPHMIEYRS
jgi:hypothetical protein